MKQQGKIKGIQIIAKEISYPFIGITKSGCYLKDFKEMTIDFIDGISIVVGKKELLKMIDKIKKEN